MEIREMKLEDIEARMSAIEAELAKDDADVEALGKEVDELNARAKEIKENAEKRAALLSEVINERGTKTMETIKENKVVEEVRNSKAYIDAFANYIKTEDPTECRALLSENATNGTVAVPDMVSDIMRHAWESMGIMSRVTRTYIKGNYKIGFEISGSEAVIHAEGAAAPSEETLSLGITNLVPASLKKWITVSDEAMDLTGEAFLRYIYEELAYKIAKLSEDTLVSKIVASPATSSATAPAVATMASATNLTLSTIIDAEALLSDEATNPVVIMNRSTRAEFKGLQIAANYAVDPFDGLTVITTSALPSFAEADEGEAFLIVGDLGRGAIANFPNGEDITFKFDDLSLAEKDLVKIVGREYVALGVVAPYAFATVTKPEA